MQVGYRPDYPAANEATLVRDQHALEFSDERTRVELHWALLERHLRLDIPEPELWNCSTRVSCAGGSIRVLAPEHLLLFLAAHGAKHEWERPRWICDIAQLLERLSPDVTGKALRLSRDTHSTRILALALCLAREVMGAASSLPAAEALPLEGDTRRLADTALVRSKIAVAPEGAKPDVFSRADPALRQLMFWARSRERLVDRVACVARVLFVPTLADGDGPRALRWARRPFRLASRALRRSAHA